MSALVWSEALSLSMPAMDDTHQEFVELLAAVAQAPDAALPARWQTLIAHTEDHFGREDDWMRATGFAVGNCHSTQHAVVLSVMREGAERAARGDLAAIRTIAHELALWFPQHAQTMDAGLALHLKNLGYDPVTGELLKPSGLPTQPVTGCGSTQCHDRAQATPAAAL